jgi:PelA/Pel-15E family pectate lyase
VSRVFFGDRVTADQLTFQAVTLHARTTLLALATLIPATLFSAPTADEVTASMKRAATFYAGEVAVEGGYVYYYSSDLTKRLGEGPATATEIWVQPPGTPAVGEAFLGAYAATTDPFYLDAARKAGKALAYGQLESGGWRNSIDFDSAGPRIDQYRNGKGKGKNFSTLDDDISQAALRFLIRLDAATSFADAEVHGAVEYALPRLLAAQYPNGGFPQGWTGPVETRPVVKATFPDYDWRTEGRIKEYWNEYTLNDGLAGTVAETLILAHQIYKEPGYLEALKKLGGFLLLAQLPEPQPGWAQQYSATMVPIWARAFEPPAVSGRESGDAMLSLLKIAEATGDRSFAAPVVAGVKYLERSLLPDGQLARYYEIGTNKPLYMQRAGKGYELTHDDSALPDHYGWKNPSPLSLIKDAYRALVANRALAGVTGPPPLEVGAVEKIIAALDAKGRWVSVHDGGETRLVGQPKFQPGEEYLSSAVFVENVQALSRALLSAKP